MVEITSIFENTTITVKNEDVSEAVREFADALKVLDHDCLNRPVVQALSDVPRTPQTPRSLKSATAGQLLEWLRSEPTAHSKTYIAKHCGMTGVPRLLKELERRGDIRWYETLYGTKTGRTRTMQAAFVDGALPPVTLDSEAKAEVLQWVKDNPGYAPHHIDNYCGVVKSKAKRALDILIANEEVEVVSQRDGAAQVFPVE